MPDKSPIGNLMLNTEGNVFVERFSIAMGEDSRSGLTFSILVDSVTGKTWRLSGGEWSEIKMEERG